MDIFEKMFETDWGGVFAVVITGMVVVFLVLILLILSVWLLGLVMRSFSGRDSRKKESKQQEEKKARPIQENITPDVAASPQDGALAAVISAAIYAYLESTAPGKQFAIKSIRPVGIREGRKAWAQAGILDSTAPF